MNDCAVSASRHCVAGRVSPIFLRPLLALLIFSVMLAISLSASEEVLEPLELGTFFRWKLCMLHYLGSNEQHLSFAIPAKWRKCSV